MEDTYRRAIQLGEEVLRRNPRDIEALARVALYYARLRNHKKALARITKALELGPKIQKVVRKSMQVYEQLGLRDQALDALRRYVELDGSLEEIEIRDDPDLKGLLKDPHRRQIIEGE